VRVSEDSHTPPTHMFLSKTKVYLPYIPLQYLHHNRVINPLRYSSLRKLNEVHAIGEVWANMLHNVYAALVEVCGFSSTALTGSTGEAGNVVYMHLLMGALPLQPCNPTCTFGCHPLVPPLLSVIDSIVLVISYLRMQHMDPGRRESVPGCEQMHHLQGICELWAWT
jgi:hypothetical protein